MSYIKAAFYQTLTEAKTAEVWYVCLYMSVPYYGGPEEGGWWGSDEILQAYEVFPSEELAELAAAKVRELAEDLSKEEKDRYNQYLADSCEWLDARGLDADFLPEIDGECKYYVTVVDELPSPMQCGPRHFE